MSALSIRTLIVTITLGVVIVVTGASELRAQDEPATGAWPSYGGNAESTKYSPLDQIDATNVARLQVAWEWVSPDGPIMLDHEGVSVSGLAVTPLMVDGVLYVRTSLSIVAAIDAATGETLWSFDSGSWESGRPPNLGYNTRGVGYW